MWLKTYWGAYLVSICEQMGIFECLTIPVMSKNAFLRKNLRNVWESFLFSVDVNNCFMFYCYNLCNILFYTLIILCKVHNPTNGSADSEALLLLWLLDEY